MDKQQLLDKLANAIADGDSKSAAAVAEEIVRAGIDPVEATISGATKGLDVVGERYKKLEAFLPDLISAGEAMQACVAVFKKHIKAEDMAQINQGKVVIGTVYGDIHDIGKNLVATMLVAAGFEVIDLGINVPVKRFVEESEKSNANIIALSALLTQSSYYQKQLIDYLKDAGIRNKYFVVVGGAPVSAEWAKEIGADGYSRTAVGATQLLKKLVADKKTPPLAEPVIINQ